MSAKKTYDDVAPRYVPDGTVFIENVKFQDLPLCGTLEPLFGYELTTTNGDIISFKMNTHVVYCEQFDLEATFKPEDIIGKRLVSVDYASNDMLINETRDVDGDYKQNISEVRCLTIRILIDQEEYFIRGWAEENYDNNDRYVIVDWPGHHNRKDLIYRGNPHVRNSS